MRQVCSKNDTLFQSDTQAGVTNTILENEYGLCVKTMGKTGGNRDGLYGGMFDNFLILWDIARGLLGLFLNCFTGDSL